MVLNVVFSSLVKLCIVPWLYRFATATPELALRLGWLQHQGSRGRICAEVDSSVTNTTIDNSKLCESAYSALTLD